MDVWPDAYSAYYPSDGYVAVPLRHSLIEPLDDYSFEKFMRWLDIAGDYELILRQFRSKEY